jgi:hypothetical protein
MFFNEKRETVLLWSSTLTVLFLIQSGRRLARPVWQMPSTSPRSIARSTFDADGKPPITLNLRPSRPFSPFGQA